MRSTRATAAVERLKTRSGNNLYSMVRTADGMFYLVLGSGVGAPTPQSDALPMEAFVKFVDGSGPQIPKRVSRLDLAFEAQLVRKKN
ncbi:MAG: hypothetical protein ACHP7O_05955 [Burkholderiales bacterium]